MTLEGKPLSIDATELYTWFERDRQHVELRSKLDDKTIVEWWDEAVTEAVDDGFIDPRDYHSTAYEYACERGLLPLVPRHYVYGSGEHGYLYDNGPQCAETLKDAVESLARTFNLGRTRKAQLKRGLYLELNPRRDGADYCEITECDCDNPLDHQD